MSNQPCTCCRGMSESSEKRHNFYNAHFIPHGWRLDYCELSGWKELILTGYCRKCYGDLEEKIPVPEGLANDDLLRGIYDAIQAAHPYDKFDKRIGYHGTCKERSAIYNAWDKRSQFQRSKIFLDLFHDYDRAQVRRWLEAKFPTQSHSQVLRDTAGDLFCTLVRMAGQAGDLNKAGPILDYTLPNAHEVLSGSRVKLTAYEFDFVPIINFGGSEGIYLDCYLMGKFDGSGRYSVHIGSMKTLETSQEACKIMGELGGALLYHADRYVNEQIHRYTPDEQLRAEEHDKVLARQNEATDPASEVQP